MSPEPEGVTGAVRCQVQSEKGALSTEVGSGCSAAHVTQCHPPGGVCWPALVHTAGSGEEGHLGELWGHHVPLPCRPDSSLNLSEPQFPHGPIYHPGCWSIS